MRLEPHQAEQFLANHYGDEVSGFERLLGGEWSEAFGFSANGSDMVIRFGDHVDDFEKDRAASGFSSGNLPIPDVLEIGPAFGGHFCISRRVFGEMIDGLGASRMELLVPAVLRVLDALREADFDRWVAEVGAPPVTWTEQLLSVDEENDRVFGWHDRMAMSRTGTEPYKEALSYVRSHIDLCPNVRHLLHNDLLHYNMLVNGDKIAGVIDWGCAGGGDFLYELALFTFYAPWYPSMTNINWAKEVQRHYSEIGLEVPEFEERLQFYEVHIGLAGMAYSAFTSNWNELEQNAARTMGRIRH